MRVRAVSAGTRVIPEAPEGGWFQWVVTFAGGKSMRPWLQPASLVVVAALLIGCPCSGFVNVPLTNAEMVDFTSGVADYWNSFAVGSNVPAGLGFFTDAENYRSSPYSQGISGIDISEPPGSLFGAGLCRQVSVTPGKVYMFVGFQDVYDNSYAPPPARRYAHFFGIEPSGGLVAPQPFTTDGVRWMAAVQRFYNDMPGNSTQVGGLHRCISAWPAAGSTISLWSGVHVYGDAPASLNPTVFNIDSHTLYEFDNPARNGLQNGGFETVDNLTPSLPSDDVHRITLPAYWVPIGGGIGQRESYYTDFNYKRSGGAGLRIYNQRGTLTRGVMQRVTVPQYAWQATFSAWVKANKPSGAVARVGIDPTGGDDISSNAIVWTYYTRTDAAWEQVSVTVPCSGSLVTVFLAMNDYAGTTGGVRYADFDDTALSFGQDTTPPDAFTVTAPSPWPHVSFLTAQISPPPHDAETGISAVDYAIGTAPGGEDVRAYTPCPDHSRVSAAGLSLLTGQTYYITVRAANGMGNTTTAASNGITCTAQPCACSPSEVTATGTFKYPLAISGATAWKSVPYVYVKAGVGAGGTRVIAGGVQETPHYLNAIGTGDIVDVSGYVSMVDGQKTIGCIDEAGQAVEVSVSKIGETLYPTRPLCMGIRSLGGKQGVTGGVGINNVGALTRIAGRVNAVGADERGVKVIYVDDGSKLRCGPGYGCKVYALDSTVTTGDLVVITGISSTELYDPTPGSPGDESYIRVLMPVGPVEPFE